MVLGDVLKKLLDLLHKQLAVLLVHIDRPGVLQLLILDTFQEILNFLKVIKPFHLVVAVLGLGYNWIGLILQKFLLGFLLKRLWIDVHCEEEVLLLFLGQRFKNYMANHIDLFILLLAQFEAPALYFKVEARH